VLLGVLPGLLAGAGLGVAVGTRWQPEQRYTIGVGLSPGSTPEQKDRIAAALPGRPRFQTREEALAKAKEQFKDRPEILAGLRLEDAQESYQTTSRSRGFDCATSTAIRRLPGVEQVTVRQEPAGDRPGAYLDCPR
jgi:FtsX-like permease family protein